MTSVVASCLGTILPLAQSNSGSGGGGIIFILFMLVALVIGLAIAVGILWLISDALASVPPQSIA